MRVGPSEPACRSRLQTTSSCSGKEPGWWALKEKAWQRSCQVRFRETSTSEPITRCRKLLDDVKTRGLSLPQEKSRGNLPTAWMASGIQVAWTWIGLWCGTWEPVIRMVREKPKWNDSARVKVPMPDTGADQLVVVLKSL